MVIELLLQPLFQDDWHTLCYCQDHAKLLSFRKLAEATGA